MKLDCTVMVLHGVLDDGKAEARAAACLRVALVHAVEALEDAALVLRRDADARIGHGDERLAVPFTDAHGHAATLDVVLDGVVAEVIDDLVQKPPYASDGLAPALDGDRDVLLRRRGLEIVRRLLRKREQVDRLARHFVALVELGQADDVADQRDKALRFFPDMADEAGDVLLLHHTVFQQLRAADDALQRRFELVRHVRREFTANVSHELKTPLQGIIGSAELLENGMVKQEDVPRFVGHIRKEAQRLVTLIGDIIRLSQLDEGDEMPRETVDLLTLSQEAADDLKTAAAEKHIAIAVEGGSETIGGVRRLLYEVIYNLCDNAIKYNVEGGSVTMSVGERDGKAFVSVADTGIGIAPEHQSRIFERFYRVDKSHSKASGGTGLGLSIVKHAVQYHHGTVELHSEEGKGTTICILLPKE